MWDASVLLVGLLTANNPAFRRFYRLPGDRAAKIRAGGPVLDEANEALGHLETLFPEVTIESFRRVAAGLSSQFDVAVVEAGGGRVVIDSRRPQRVGARRAHPGGHPVAYQRLQPPPGNANDWYVVAVARAPAGPLYGVSGWPIALVAAALALFVFAGVSFLAQHRRLVATSMTDALTGISNRRKLKLDLEEGSRSASPAEPLLLMLFDSTGQGLQRHLRPPACGPRRARTSPRPCSWSTSACTPRRPAAAARPTARAAVVDAFSELVVELVWPTATAALEVSGGGAR
jgi:hypothetical protein